MMMNTAKNEQLSDKIKRQLERLMEIYRRLPETEKPPKNGGSVVKKEKK